MAGPRPLMRRAADRNAQALLLGVVALAGPFAAGAVVAHRLVDGVAVVVATAVVCAVVVRPDLGAYLLVAVVPITAGFQRGFPVPGVNLSQALVGVVGGLIILTAPRHARLRWRAFDWLLLAFCLGWLLFGLLDAKQLGTGTGLSGVETLLGPFQFLILYRAVLTALGTARQRVLAVTVLLVASVPVDLLVYLQQAHIPAVNAFITKMTGSTIFQSQAYQFFARATGPFPHWTPLAGYLLVILLVAVGCLLHDVELPLRRSVLVALVVATAISLAFSAELSAIVGAALGSAVLAVWAGRTREAAWISGLVVLAVVVAAGPYLAERLATQYASTAGSGRSSLVAQTLSFRWDVWTTQYLPAIVQRPLTGWGLALPSSISWPFTESQYITILMAGGLPLLAVFGAELVALYSLGRRMRWLPAVEDPRTAVALGDTLAILVVVLAVICLIYPYVTSSGLPAPLFALSGIVGAAAAWSPVPRAAPVPPALRPALR